jgi:transposase
MAKVRGRRRVPRRKISGREAIRRQGYRLLRRGIPKSRIASMLGVRRVTVWRWEQRIEKLGPHSWKDRKIPGGPRKLNEKKAKRLREILLEGALAHGYATDLWTLKRVAEIIEKECGEEYTPSGVWHVLRDLGMSAQVPIPRALERDEAYIRHWKKVEWPKIQREARRTGATILFLDESFVQSEPNVRRTWWIEGKRPEIQVRQGKRMKLSLISAVGVKGQLYFEVSEMNENFDGGGVIEFLRYLLKEVRGRILLLWDNGTIHRRRDVKEFLWEARKRLKTRRFPAYAPELNPDELVWSALKYQRLSNFCPRTEEEIREGVERELRWLQAHSDFVAGCIRHVDIPLPG